MCRKDSAKYIYPATNVTRRILLRTWSVRTTALKIGVHFRVEIPADIFLFSASCQLLEVSVFCFGWQKKFLCIIKMRRPTSDHILYIRIYTFWEIDWMWQWHSVGFFLCLLHGPVYPSYSLFAQRMFQHCSWRLDTNRWDNVPVVCTNVGIFLWCGALNRT